MHLNAWTILLSKFLFHLEHDRYTVSSPNRHILYSSFFFSLIRLFICLFSSDHAISTSRHVAPTLPHPRITYGIVLLCLFYFSSRDLHTAQMDTFFRSSHYPDHLFSFRCCRGSRDPRMDWINYFECVFPNTVCVSIFFMHSTMA